VSETAPAVRRFTRFLHVFPIVAFRGLAGGMPILIGLYIAHRWGLASLGAYTFASSYVAVGLMITDWGCTRWLPRELALVRMTAGAPATAASTANALRLMIAAAFLLFTGVLAAAHLLPADSTRFALELGLLCPITIYSMNGVSDRIVTREIGGIAAAVFTGLALFAMLAFAGNSFAPGPDAIILAYVIGRAAEAAIMMHGRADLYPIALRHLLPTAAALWPFSIQAILAVIYSRLSVFMIEHFRRQDLGLVGAASALQNILLLFPVSIALLNYPPMTTAAANGERRRLHAVLLVSAASSVAALAVAAGVLFAARRLVAATLHIPLQAMPLVLAYAGIAFITVATTLAGVVLQAMRHEKLTARLSFLTVAFALVYQYILIRSFGLWGLVGALAAAEATSAAIFGIVAFRAIRHATILQSGKMPFLTSSKSFTNSAEPSPDIRTL
jgi:O-antigen/teichoic acid export membrane protein